MKTKYGCYSPTQIDSIKDSIRKSIFFLLLYVDPETKEEYRHISVADAFKNLQLKLNGLNSMLFEPKEIVTVMGLLEAALLEYGHEDFDFKVYRKLILDAGAEIMRLKDGDTNG